MSFRMPRSPIYNTSYDSDGTTTLVGSVDEPADHIITWNSASPESSRKRKEPYSIKHHDIARSEKRRFSSAFHQLAEPLTYGGFEGVEDKQAKRHSVRLKEIRVPERLFPASSYNGFTSPLPQMSEVSAISSLLVRKLSSIGNSTDVSSRTKKGC